jgi:DNA-binding CsgD family transcriptional regulator
MLDARESRTRWALALLGVATYVLMLVIEQVTDGDPFHLWDFLGDALQTLLLVATAVACAMLAVRVKSQHEDQLQLTRDLAQARAEGEGWRREAREHLEGVGMAIERQFETWRMTDAEREVGLLMLKGFTHKEIGAFRGTSEATVRHQAKAIYQKAGVDSRTAFCAYFLEDLLPANGNGSRARA